MARGALLSVILCWLAAAQLPTGLRERLNDPLPFVREKAVKELGALEPSSQVSAATLASTLATALKDKDQSVREAAAGFLGARRPSDIAVPALVRALGNYEQDCGMAWARMAAKAKEGRKPDIFDFSNLFGVEGYGKTMLWSLEDHWDERAVSGLCQVVKGWKLDRVPGSVVRRACELLCHWGTRPAFDTVVEVLTRAQGLPETRRSEKATTSRPDGTPVLVVIRPLSQEDFLGIRAALDVAVASKGIEKPLGFDPSAPPAWRALLISNAARVPWALPASRPATASRPSSQR